MNKLMLAIIALVSLAVGVILFYNKMFAKNVQRALHQTTDVKLPDLNDVVSAIIILCILAGFAFSMNLKEKQFRNHVGTCYKNEVSVEGLPDNYSICKNQYDNVIFSDQINVLKQIRFNYQPLMDKLTEERAAISTDYIDNLYYTLRQSRNTEEEEELYVLLAIYLNYFQTKQFDYIKGSGY